MTVLSRGARNRRGGRRPGWLLLTVLLVLAIGASSALVFTNRVELLKLAVILSLWAAVVGAFVSVIYRRQSDADQARARDLKLVYDLQLDREISARREYELTVETELRRELSSEIRAQAADVAVVNVAPLGGVAPLLHIASQRDVPIVVSSALDSAVGMSRGLLAAACLPDLRYACGLGTGGLFVEDVVDPGPPVDGRLPVAAVVPDPARLSGLAAPPDRRRWWVERIAACYPLLS